jgi:hypothetical protein
MMLLLTGPSGRDAERRDDLLLVEIGTDDAGACEISNIVPDWVTGGAGAPEASRLGNALPLFSVGRDASVFAGANTSPEAGFAKASISLPSDSDTIAGPRSRVSGVSSSGSAVRSTILPGSGLGEPDLRGFAIGSVRSTWGRGAATTGGGAIIGSGTIGLRAMIVWKCSPSNTVNGSTLRFDILIFLSIRGCFQLSSSHLYA